MTRRLIEDVRGQGLVEFTLLMPLMLVMTLGIIEVGSAILDEHVAAKLTREGSNLISRDVSLDTAEKAVRSMSTGPVKFPDDARVIFSVVRQGSTTGTANYQKNVLYQRHQFGSLAGSSFLNNKGGSFTGPDHTAKNPDADTTLRVTNLPPALQLTPGGTVYITEVYTKHERLTPLDRFGIKLPEKLYSVAYF